MNHPAHAPQGYVCPFCEFASGKDDDYSQQADVVYKNEFTTAFVAPKWWIHNPGQVLVIPNKHYENIYGISDDDIAEVYKTVKKIATAIRSTYDCDGTSTRQHNEPAGNQDVWHFHVQVFPRFHNDRLYHNQDNNRFVDAKARAPYAKQLRAYFAGQVAKSPPENFTSGSSSF